MGGLRGRYSERGLHAVVAVITLTFLVGGMQGLRAQTTPIMELTRLTSAVTLDGYPNEAAWADVPALPLTMYFPTFGGEPQERTEIRVAYDDDYLYAAGWFYDSDPAGIRINSLYRDRWNGDDAFAIYVDAFNDNQNAKWFGTTPSAMRFDVLVSDDGQGLNSSWDSFWDSETTVTEEGWFVEVRIPFSTIGFQVDDEGRAEMGLTVTRLVSRTGERVTFPAIDPQFLFRQPSVAQDVVLRGVETSRPAYITPYALAGYGRDPSATAPGEPAGYETEYSREVGLDVRYSVASNLTMDLTVNTDFAQVEADDQQVNLDRFSLFFPEKRRFFQEQSGVFDFSMGAGTQLFHSRRIGLTDSNEPVPVFGGVRLVGRINEWDVGFLEMQTDDLGPLPTENFGTLRARRRAFNEFSTIGGMVTNRYRSDAWNVATGLDGSFRLFGDTYLTTKWAGTFDDRGSDDLASASQVYVLWQQRASRGFGYQASVTYSGEDFRPELGFLARSDFTRATAFGNYYIFTDDHPFLRRIYPGFLAFQTFRNADNSLESGQYAVWLQWETKSGGSGWIEPKLFIEDVANPFVIGGEAGIPAGRYTYADLQIAWGMPAGRRLRASVDARAGTFFDGERVQVIVKPTWNASPHLELGVDYQWTSLRFSERQYVGPATPAFGPGRTDIHLARLRVRTALDSRASGNAFVQYNSTSDRLDFNVRLRYNFAEGQDLWFVFNEGLATDRMLDPTQPEIPLSQGRTMILKYTYTWGG
jgi:hypothetical protein